MYKGDREIVRTCCLKPNVLLIVACIHITYLLVDSCLIGNLLVFFKQREQKNAY